ncbi:MAG: DUF2057 domain-containing protein, partial [Shewanella sp.]
MKYQSIVCATALILGAVQPATADVNVNLPNNAELLTVNGKQVEKTRHLVLADGMNQLAFRYAAQYRQQAETVRYLSDVIIVKFNASAQTLTLTLPAINSGRDAKKFDESPKLTLLTAQAEAVSFTSDKLIKNGVQLGRDFEHEILQYNLSNQAASISVTMNNAPAQSSDASAPLSQASVVAPTVIAPVIAPIAATVNEPSPQTTVANTPSQAEISQMLDYWYKQANDTTKASFKAKIN